MKQDWYSHLFLSYILLLICWNKPCLLTTSSLPDLSKQLFCCGYLQSTGGCLKPLFLMRTTDAGHLTITRAASSLCLTSMKPSRFATATPSAKLSSWPTRRLGQVGHGCCWRGHQRFVLDSICWGDKRSLPPVSTVRCAGHGPTCGFSHNFPSHVIVAVWHKTKQVLPCI